MNIKAASLAAFIFIDLSFFDYPHAVTASIKSLCNNLPNCPVYYSAVAEFNEGLFMLILVFASALGKLQMCIPDTKA